MSSFVLLPCSGYRLLHPKSLFFFYLRYLSTKGSAPDRISPHIGAGKGGKAASRASTEGFF